MTQAHKQRIAAFSTTSDEHALASASADKDVHIWDLDAGKPRLRSTLSGHPDGATAVAFSADGKRVATASADGTGRIWLIDPLSIALARKPRELTSEERKRYELDPPANP